MGKRKLMKTISLDEEKREQNLKPVRITDKIVILVPRNVPDDEARQEFLLKIQERDRRYAKNDMDNLDALK